MQPALYPTPIKCETKIPESVITSEWFGFLPPEAIDMYMNLASNHTNCNGTTSGEVKIGAKYPEWIAGERTRHRLYAAGVEYPKEDPDSVCLFLQKNGLINIDEDGSPSILEKVQYPEHVLRFPFLFVRQLVEFRYVRHYLPRLLAIHEELIDLKRVILHPKDLANIIGVRDDEEMYHVLRRAQRERRMQVEFKKKLLAISFDPEMVFATLLSPEEERTMEKLRLLEEKVPVLRLYKSELRQEGFDEGMLYKLSMQGHLLFEVDSRNPDVVYIELA